MLEVVLLILKTAGIILAVILGILIVAVCAVLFVPVRYRGDFSVADAAQGEGKEVKALLRAAWFLRLVRVYVSYEKTVRVRVKIFFFTLMDTAKEKQKGKKGKAGGEAVSSAKEREETSAGEREPEADESAESGDSLETGVNLDGQAGKVGEESGDGLEAGGNPGGQVGKSGEEPEDNGNKEEDASQKEKKGIKSRIDKILQTIRAFCDKLKRVKERAESIKELWTADYMVNSRSLLGKQLIYLLKHTKPKKLEGYLRFGFEEPSTTGYAMAVYGILYPLWSPKLSVEPDFEKQILDCHILLKGKIRAWHFVRVVLRMILSGDVRRVIKDVRKL